VYENDMKIIEQAQKGSKEAMTKLLEDNNGLIWSIVRRFSGRGYEVEDLYQIGSIGFIKAIQRFDTSFEVRLSTYAVPYILGEIKRFIRDDGPIKVSRSIKELNVKILELQKQYFNKNGKEITLDEISKELKISKEEITMALDSTRPVDSIESAKYIDSKTDKTISIIEQISTGKDEQTVITNRLVIKNLISELEDKEKEIIMLRYYKQKTQMQVSKILGITQVQVSRIERKVLDNMRRKLSV
jgi:RNA polymerase sporulation-specific sigma factor